MFEYWNREVNYIPVGGSQTMDNGAVVELDLPGVDRDKIEIKQKDRFVYIYAERKKENIDYDERYFGKIRRTIKVSFEIEKIEAELKNGVLKLDIYAKEASKAKKIEIRVAS